MAKILVTSALPYVNNIPHLGNLIGATLSADVYARAMRLAGHDVLYVCGADEHGTATETKAKEEGLTPEALCDKYGRIHKEIYDWFGISFDVWGRTHTDTQTRIVQGIFTKLHENGYIHEEEVEQLYDETAQQFLADRFVEGTCPHCGAPGARGDQCDTCQQLINAIELKEPKSKLTGTTPIIKRTKHLFLDLPKLQPKLEEWMSQAKKGWSENTKSITENWLENLKSRAITRDLSWGVPVPLEGYADKVFYVWFDAPIGYISITAHARDDWEEWWKNPDTTLAQFMGKDNVVFHSVIFPSTLLGTGEEWTLVDKMSTTEFLNMQDGKFSKSRGTGVFGDDAIAIEEAHGIPADVWRYYLLSIRPEKADTAFSWKDFQSRTNNELIANYANLVHRTLTFAHKHKDIAPEVPANAEEYLGELRAQEQEAIELLKQGKLREALHAIMLLSKDGNATYQELEPWKLPEEQAAGAMLLLMSVVRDLSILLHPYIPHATQKVWEMLKLDKPNHQDLGTLMGAETLKDIEKPEPLFKKVEDETIMTLQETYTPQEPALDLRVAEIQEAKKHPNADRLLVLSINLGEEQRQLVAGLAGHYAPEELIGTKIVIVANLAPAKLRGEKSEGMLLAGEKDGAVGLLRPDADPGTRLTIGGRPGKDEEISFEEFQTHTIRADKDGVTVDDKPVDGTFRMDKEAYGKLR